VYIADDVPDEPDVQFVPDLQSVSQPAAVGTDLLARSLRLLQEQLDSGAAISQFEVSASLNRDTFEDF